MNQCCRHLGPYVACRNGTKTVQRRYRCCPQCDTPPAAQANFCMACGAAVAEKVVDVMTIAVDENTVRDLLGNNLVVATRLRDLDVWVGNKQGDSPGRDYREDQEGCLPVDARLIQAETDYFRRFYENELEALRQAYGDNKVVVRWGLVTYWA